MIRHAVNVARSLLRERAKRKRSPKWEGVERAFKKDHPLCAACGGTKRVQVHHVEPFHLRPDLELESSNLISLCMAPEECHFLIGHGGDWKSFNPNVRFDALFALTNPTKVEWVEAKAKRSAAAQKLVGLASA